MSLDELALMVGRVEGKLDAFVDSFGGHQKALGELETRVDSIEGWNAKLLALGATIGGAVTAAVQWIRGA